MCASQVKVILGEDREATGVLLSIDGEDGIVRMELDEQLKILNLRFLGKLEVWRTPAHLNTFYYSNADAAD